MAVIRARGSHGSPIESVGETLAPPRWAEYGRDYYTGHDYEGVDKESEIAGIRTTPARR